MEYLILKWIHILSATLMFGTGLGSAFYKFMADRSGNIQSIVQTNRNVVLADWIFTTPAIIIQPITGVMLALSAGYPMTSGWLLMAIILYVIAGLCWLPVVALQIRMREMAYTAVVRGEEIDKHYKLQTHIWFWLGILAFSALVIVYYLMIFKPGF